MDRVAERLGVPCCETTTGWNPGVSSQSIVLLVGGLVYLLTPVDAIPDAIPGIGLIDDVAVLSFVFGQLKHELAQFRDWLEQSADVSR